MGGGGGGTDVKETPQAIESKSKTETQIKQSCRVTLPLGGQRGGGNK